MSSNQHSKDHDVLPSDNDILRHKSKDCETVTLPSIHHDRDRSELPNTLLNQNAPEKVTPGAVLRKSLQSQTLSQNPSAQGSRKRVSRSATSDDLGSCDLNDTSLEDETSQNISKSAMENEILVPSIVVESERVSQGQPNPAGPKITTPGRTPQLPHPSPTSPTTLSPSAVQGLRPGHKRRKSNETIPPYENTLKEADREGEERERERARKMDLKMQNKTRIAQKKEEARVKKMESDMQKEQRAAQKKSHGIFHNATTQSKGRAVPSSRETDEKAAAHSAFEIPATNKPISQPEISHETLASQSASAKQVTTSGASEESQVYYSGRGHSARNKDT